MNIIKRELKANLLALLVWCGAGFGIVYAGMLKFESFSAVNTSMGHLSEMIPKPIRIIFAFDSFDITTVAGYYGMMFLYFLLIGGIHAVMLGAVIISKEERDRTADFIFVKPLNRAQIITNKLLAGVINLLVLNLVILVTSIYITSKFQGDYSLNTEIYRLMFALFLLQVMFFLIGTAISALTHETKKALGIATGVMLGTYLLSIVIDLYDKIAFLKYVTPFKYFESKQLMFGGSFQPVFIVLTLLIYAVSLYLTYRGYKRHDFKI